LKESTNELELGNFVDSKCESSNSLKSKYDHTEAKTEDTPVKQESKSYKKSARKTKTKLEFNDD